MNDPTQRRVRGRARLASIMLAMSIACAASGILMDARVMGLLAEASAGTMLQQDLERADEVATLLLFFSLAVNAACLMVCLVWFFGSMRASWFVMLAALAIPLANPVAPFLIRGHESGLEFAILAKLLGIAAAIAAMILVRRTGGRR